MFNPEKLAVDLLARCISVPPQTNVLAGMTAQDLASLAAHVIDTCPKCGATAWVNIDCDLCSTCHRITRDEPLPSEGKTEEKTR